MPIIDSTGFIGQGLIWPISLVNGRAQLATGLSLLNASVAIITQWHIGNRIMMGEFGSRITEILEEQNTAALKSLLRTFFQDAVAQWETRLIYVDMSIIFPTSTSVAIRYYYKVTDTAPVESFVVPFYRNIIA